MKILHICLAAHYTEGMAYQDNLLPEQNAADGCEVVIVSDSFAYAHGALVRVPAGERKLPSGILLVRLDYDRVINSWVSAKVRLVRKLGGILDREKPDVILHHAASGMTLIAAARYVRLNPHVPLYVDCHADKYNSGRSIPSRLIQYRLFNRAIINFVRKYVRKFLYVTYESREFLRNMYGLDDAEMEFFPLGGIIESEQVRKDARITIRSKHRCRDNDIVILHSGKLDPAKKTALLLDALYDIECDNLRLIIIGSISSKYKPTLMPKILRDDRVEYLGWKDSNELQKYLCASDLYFQPGSRSATLQVAACCGSAVAVFPFIDYTKLMADGAFYVRDFEDCKSVMQRVSDDPSVLRSMAVASYEVACRQLDYRVLARRLYLA